ncbi:MAG: pyruvate/2-oxoglutarate dehydrogenase complex dihydrolipoamide acyltransferase (E2) component [Maritalea sp.]|jgi:pyruvate/2-oxoglutarate dehydrogenase complex dihydrolipoamide acyltransferase (E2) component
MPPSQAVPATPAPPPSSTQRWASKNGRLVAPPSVDGRWREDGIDNAAGEQRGDKVFGVGYFELVRMSLSPHLWGRRKILGLSNAKS